MMLKEYKGINGVEKEHIVRNYTNKEIMLLEKQFYNNIKGHILNLIKLLDSKEDVDYGLKKKDSSNIVAISRKV